MKFWSTALLFSCLPFYAVQAQVDGLPYALQADEISFDDVNNTLAATGGVEISNGEDTIRADKIIYDQNADSLVASGNVVYKDSTSKALMLDELTITGDLKTATLHEMRLRTQELGEILHAEDGSLENGIYTLENSTYSPCKTCEGERKPWQIRAKKVQFNEAENELSYEDAVLDVYGVPVIYLPYFRHPIKQNEAKSGFLAPRFGSSTNLGKEINLAYYHYLPEQNQDITVRTRYMSERGLMGQLETRGEQTSTDFDIRTSFIKDDRTDSWRSHAYAEGEYVLKKGRRVGFNGAIASDDTYLNDFFNETKNYLPSTLYLEDADQDHYFTVNTTWYQDLETTRDPAQTAQVLPHLQFERLWQTDDTGGQFTFSTDALVLHRSQGSRYRRVVASGEYVKPFMLPAGNRLTFSTMLRGDFYNVDGNSDDGNTLRGLGEASLLWERPMVSPDGSHLMTPLAMLIMAPKGGNPEDIPNEDSVAYELEINNLFSSNRFAGLDRVENGLRFIYGLDNRWGTPNQTKWRLFVGQTWRRDDDDALPTSGGTATQMSDWVGLLEASPRDWLNLYSSFRLDNADWNARRVDTSLRIGRTDGAHIQATHSLLYQGPEELNLELELPLTDRWQLSAETQRDIRDGARQLYGQIELAYTYNCYRVTLLTRRRGFTTTDLQPSTDYLLNLELLSLGAD